MEGVGRGGGSGGGALEVFLHEREDCPEPRFHEHAERAR